MNLSISFVFPLSLSQKENKLDRHTEKKRRLEEMGRNDMFLHDGPQPQWFCHKRSITHDNAVRPRPCRESHARAVSPLPRTELSSPAWSPALSQGLKVAAKCLRMHIVPGLATARPSVNRRLHRWSGEAAVIFFGTRGVCTLYWLPAVATLSSLCCTAPGGKSQHGD